MVIDYFSVNYKKITHKYNTNVNTKVNSIYHKIVKL